MFVPCLTFANPDRHELRRERIAPTTRTTRLESFWRTTIRRILACPGTRGSQLDKHRHRTYTGEPVQTPRPGHMSVVDEPSISVEPVVPARSLWLHPSFLKLWVGETASATGTQISAVAIPLTAVVYLHANAFQVGLLTMFETLAFLVIGLPSGPLVDRSRKRPLMLAANLGRMVTLGSIPAAAAFGVLAMTQLYIAALAVGLLSVPFGIAYQSYLPELVDRRAVVEGSSKMQASSSAAVIVGPSIAGALIGVVTAPGAILVDSASYLVSPIMIHSIPAEAESRPAPAPRRR